MIRHRALSRRSIFKAAPVFGVAALLGPQFSWSADSPIKSDVVPESFPRQDPAVAMDVVRYSHFDVERVRKLVEGRPALACAAWDWGFGDWESALGAASHMGRVDIAEVLMTHGARPNLFTAAMLGQLAIVKATVAANPGVQGQAGPHGITLLAHARAGGERAQSVVAFLETVVDADSSGDSMPLDDAMKAVYVGVYAFGAAADDRVEVTIGKWGLMLGRVGQVGRVLTHLGKHEFHPAGAPAVRIRFTLSDNNATAVEIEDAELAVRCSRV